MFRTSFVVGFAALAACALCYAGAAGFMGSLIARREKGYRVIDLFGIGTIGLFIIAAGSFLMIWSHFSMHAFDVEIGGVTWAPFRSRLRCRCGKKKGRALAKSSACVPPLF